MHQLDIFFVRRELVASCAPTSLPSFEEAAAGPIPFRMHHSCDESEIHRLVDVSLELQGQHHAAHKRAVEYVREQNHFFRNATKARKGSQEWNACNVWGQDICHQNGVDVGAVGLGTRVVDVKLSFRPPELQLAAEPQERRRALSLIRLTA
eukprot:1436289-Prymnesium_polylepis.1